MADGSTIEWLRGKGGAKGATWNPIAGCSLVSLGCANCYAMPMARQHEAMTAALGRTSPYAGLTRTVNGKAVWTGEVRLVPDAVTRPLQWRKPRRIFVNSMSDLFHPAVPDAVLDQVFAVMALAHWHTFIVLTKRSARMRTYLSAARAHPVGLAAMERTLHAVAADPRSTVGAGVMLQGDIVHLKVWPLPNVWVGVSAEDQRRADERVPDLLATLAALRFVSAEPLLGPLDLRVYMPNRLWSGLPSWKEPELDWVIVGGESGPGARPMHPDWARSVRDQCAAAGVPFFFKQWGAWAPTADWYAGHPVSLPIRTWTGSAWTDDGRLAHLEWVALVGKKAAGRLLDGVTHDAFPARAA